MLAVVPAHLVRRAAPLLLTAAASNCDPVNVIFPGRSPAGVRDLLRSRGWTTFDLGSTQRLHFATSTPYSQDIQVFRGDGRNAAGQSLRYHVRLWRARGTAATVTVGAVAGGTTTPARPSSPDRQRPGSEGGHPRR